MRALVTLAFLAAGARAGQVSCCFSPSHAVSSITLGGVELTPTADNSAVEFAKPSAHAVLAFRGAGQAADLFVHCVELESGQVWASSSQASRWTSPFGPVVGAAAVPEQTLCGSAVSAVRPSGSGEGWQVQTTGGVELATRPVAAKQATTRPTKRPTPDTLSPTKRPTKVPTTKRPTISPTKRPTKVPTVSPTKRPTKTPTTKRPTISPTKRPTKVPTTKRPTISPTKRPTKVPTTLRPSKAPTTRPTKRPTPDTLSPTKRPTKVPVALPTPKPASRPSDAHTQVPAFKIDLLFASALTPEEQAVFTRATARWSEVIAKSYSSSIQLESSVYCGMYFGRLAVTDLVIVVRTGRMDGVGGALGSGTICAQDELGRPRLGYVAFDNDDMKAMMATDAFYYLVLHEIGHVLGLGSKWSASGLVGDLLPETGGYAYLGRYGNAGDAEVRQQSQGVAVVEDEGGVGTARLHWKNTVYEHELMSGFMSVDGSVQPLSRLTIQALRDLGYAHADASKADEFYVTAPPVMMDEGEERRRLRKEAATVPLVGCGHDQDKTPVRVVQSLVKPGREEELETDKQAFLQRKAR